MKEKDGIIDCQEQQLILYVEKEDGKYEPVQTGSYMTRNFLDDYELKRHNLESSLKDRIISGEVSPIYYFMILEDLSLSELSARTGLRKRKVKKHLSTAGFGLIPAETLTCYAEVFNVSVKEILELADPLPAGTKYPE